MIVYDRLWQYMKLKGVSQYKLIKAERASLKKQVRSIENRIKDIDKAKERIRKNML